MVCLQLQMIPWNTQKVSTTHFCVTCGNKQTCTMYEINKDTKFA